MENRLRSSYDASTSIAVFRNGRGPDSRLLVTKDEGQYEKKLGEWWQLRTNARQNIRSMGSEYLKVLLGDCFDNIMSLTPIAIAQPPLPLPITTQVIGLMENSEPSLQARMNASSSDAISSTKPRLDVSVQYRPEARSAGSIVAHDGLPRLFSWRPPLAQRTGNIANTASGALKRKASSPDCLAGEEVPSTLRTKRPTLDIQLVPRRDVVHDSNVGAREHFKNLPPGG